MHRFLTPRNTHLDVRDPSAQNDNFAPARNGLLRRWSRAALKNWHRRKMIAALHAMDDHLLRDIAVQRNDIEQFVDGFTADELRMVPFARPKDTPQASPDTLRRAA